MQKLPTFLGCKIISGFDALSRMGDEIRDRGTRAAIITDETMVKLGIVDRIGSILKEAGYEYKFFSEVESDPSIQTVQKGAKFLIDFQPQWIVGLGGGSTLDAGKAMWILYERPEYTQSYLPEAINPTVRLGLRKKARYISIPTTSGTGADVTWAIVLTDTEMEKKMPFANPEVVPDISILDPTLPAKMPPRLTASTGMDVLAHAMEGYVSRWATDFSEGLCLKAIKMTFEWLPQAYARGDDLRAREKMHNAATIAGLGMGNSNTALAHALAHALGAAFRIHHGRLAGLTLPYSMQFNIQTSANKYAEVARYVGIDAKSPQEASSLLAKKVRDLAASIGEPLALKDEGMSKEDMAKMMERMVNNAFGDPNKYTNPRRVSREEFEKLFWCVWEGKDVDF